jgi:diguanylate cyclase (GGDEF)-like protein
VCILLLGCGTALASAPGIAPVTVSGQPTQLDGLQIALLEDPDGTLEIEDVKHAWAEGRFELSSSPLLNRGTTNSAFWARVELLNPHAVPRHVILSHDYAPMDDIRLYVEEENSVLVQRVAGDSVVPQPAGPGARLAAFELAVPPGASLPLYARIATTSNMSLEFSLWPPQQFHWREARINMVYGLLFGGIAATILYLLYAARLAREPNALLLAAYLAAFGCYLAFLNGFPSLWLPVALLPHVNTLHLASLGLLFGFGAMFYRRFLQLATYGPKFDRVVGVLQWLGFAIVLSPVLPAAVMGACLAIVAGAGPLLTTGYAFYMWYQRREFADIFAIGWTLAHASSLAGTLRVAGVLPNSDLLLHLPAAGCAVACGFFTWAIARRVARERAYAYTDFLTGLANRRRFERDGDIEFDRARRYARALSLLVVDVDHFKRVNDTRGHSFGDRVLQNVALKCQQLSRDSDLAARIGGEEFALLLIETGMDDARRIGRRLLEAQAAADVDGESITVSIGVATLTPEDRDFQSLYERADEALYSAKRGGRNQLQVNTASAKRSGTSPEGVHAGQ